MSRATARSLSSSISSTRCNTQGSPAPPFTDSGSPCPCRGFLLHTETAAKTRSGSLRRCYVYAVSEMGPVSASMAAALLSVVRHVVAAVFRRFHMLAAVVFVVCFGLVPGICTVIFHAAGLCLAKTHMHIGRLGLTIQCEEGHAGQHSEFHQISFHGLCFLFLHGLHAPYI